MATAENVIIVIGTPVDEHLNPDPNAVSKKSRGWAIPSGTASCWCCDRRLSGTTALVEATVAQLGRRSTSRSVPNDRRGQGDDRALRAAADLSSRQPAALDRAEKLFGNLASQMVRMHPEEAELAKLFTNTWRYIRFATANQLFMMANDFGLDYERIRAGLTFDYPRASDLPGAASPRDHVFSRTPCSLLPSTTTTSSSATPR